MVDSNHVVKTMREFERAGASFEIGKKGKKVVVLIPDNFEGLYDFVKDNKPEILAILRKRMSREELEALRNIPGELFSGEPGSLAECIERYNSTHLPEDPTAFEFLLKELELCALDVLQDDGVECLRDALDLEKLYNEIFEPLPNKKLAAINILRDSSSIRERIEGGEAEAAALLMTQIISHTLIISFFDDTFSGLRNRLSKKKPKPSRSVYGLELLAKEFVEKYPDNNNTEIFSKIKSKISGDDYEIGEGDCYYYFYPFDDDIKIIAECEREEVSNDTRRLKTILKVYIPEAKKKSKKKSGK